ncbi:hypothetical protein SeMB42_g06593 [Synchytrium endobioticum]|nr:hypothetical protein SeMB42_g06593 [Synchytrium endobioticum]
MNEEVPRTRPSIITHNTTKSAIKSTHQDNFSTIMNVLDADALCFDDISAWSETHHDEHLQRCLDTSTCSINYVSGDTPFPSANAATLGMLNDKPFKSRRLSASSKRPTTTTTLSRGKTSVQNTIASQRYKHAGEEEDGRRSPWLVGGEDDIEYTCANDWDTSHDTPLQTTTKLTPSARSSPRILPPPLSLSTMAAAPDAFADNPGSLIERKVPLPGITETSHTHANPYSSIINSTNSTRPNSSRLHATQPTLTTINSIQPPDLTRPPSAASRISTLMNSTATLAHLQQQLQLQQLKPARAGTPSTPMDIISVRQKLRRSANKRSMGLTAAATGSNTSLNENSRKCHGSRNSSTRTLKASVPAAAPAADPSSTHEYYIHPGRDKFIVRPLSAREEFTADTEAVSDTSSQVTHPSQPRHSPWPSTPSPGPSPDKISQTHEQDHSRWSSRGTQVPRVSASSKFISSAQAPSYLPPQQHRYSLLEPHVMSEPLMPRDMDKFAKRLLASEMCRPPLNARAVEYLTNVTKQFA